MAHTQRGLAERSTICRLYGNGGTCRLHRLVVLNFRVVPWWCCSRPWQPHRRSSRCDRWTWSPFSLYVPQCGAGGRRVARPGRTWR